MSKYDKRNGKVNFGYKGKNLLDFSPKNSECKAEIFYLEEYRNKGMQMTKNYGKLDDLDEDSYVNPDDYDLWDK